MPFSDTLKRRAWNRLEIVNINKGQRGIYGIYNSDQWIYIGKSDDLQARLLEHYDKISDQSGCIWKNKPTGFLAKLASTSTIDNEELDLIRYYNPTCNKN